MESFFNCFDYQDLYMDGGDKTINMDGVVITRDIPSLGLVKGTRYETCWWNIGRGTFHFINWMPEPEKNQSFEPNPQKSVEITQADLSQYCNW